MTGRTNAVAASAAVVVLALLASATGAFAQPAPAPAPEQALQAAGRAAQQVSFLGSLQMRWTDGRTEHTKRLHVEGANGSVILEGDTSTLASPEQRLVEHDGKWDLLWPAPLGGPARPNPAGKYEITSGAGLNIVGRPTRVVEFKDGGVVLERLYFDLETNLLLRREQFDGTPHPSRAIGFELLTIPSPNASPEKPDKVVNATGSPITGKLPAGVSAPADLPDSYKRLGVYRRSGVTQVLYSDGLYDLSVFQEEGRLDRSDLPGGRKLQIGKRTGWRYVWPGGHVVVWQARGMVHTVVSDAPLAQVMAAVTSIPASGGSASILRRLRQVCRSLVQPLS